MSLLSSNNSMGLRVALVLLTAGACVALYLAPQGGRLPLICPLHWLTGLSCPFCGGQRMVRALLHLQWAEAWRCNRLLFTLLPYAGLWMLAQISPAVARRVPGWLYGRAASAALAALLLLWGVVRNVAGV